VSKEIIVTMINQEATISPGVPLDVIESLLRDHLADPTARIVD
jgi:hypothetical protein